MKKELTPNERKELKKIITGKLDINSTKAQKLLDRPQIAITFEALLDRVGLTDEKLSYRLLNIINRKQTKGRTSTGSPTTNITSVDSNVINTVRLIWQAKGKFVDKHEVGTPGAFQEMNNEQLDQFIKQGINYFNLGGKNVITDRN